MAVAVAELQGTKSPGVAKSQSRKVAKSKAGENGKTQAVHFGSRIVPVSPDQAAPGVSAETPARERHAQLQERVSVAIPLDKIHRRPSNRGGAAIAEAEVADLAASIEQFGLSQPIEVREVSEEQELPIGHYELVKGERRWTAYRVLARKLEAYATIPAVVRTLDARQAAVQVAIDNTHRRDLDPIQRARSIQAAKERGLDLAEAGQAHGLGESATKNAVRLLELTPKLQAAIADGRLSERVARYLVPYAKLSAVMRQAEKDVADKCYMPWYLRPGASDAQVKDGVRRMAEECFRPLDGKAKHDYGYQHDGPQACAFMKELTPELKKELGATEIKIDNKPVLVATNVKRFDELQAAKREEQKKIKKQRQEKKAAKNRAEGKAANPQAEAQQDRALAVKVAAWREQFLRLSIAQHLQPGDPRTRKVVRWVSRALDCVARLDRDFEDCVREIKAVRSGREMPAALGRWNATWWERIDWCAPDGDDPISDCDADECLWAQLILWPESPITLLAGETGTCGHTLSTPGEIPTEFPALEEDGDLAAIAEQLAKPGDDCNLAPWATRWKDAWQRARGKGTEFRMLTELLSFPNRRQLGQWAKDFGVSAEVCERVQSARKVDEARDLLLQVHLTPAGKGLVVPKWLQAETKERRRK